MRAVIPSIEAIGYPSRTSCKQDQDLGILGS
ncbi:unnamed protein product, partial [Rotaria socialis]